MDWPPPDATIAHGARQMRAVLNDGWDDEDAFYSALESVWATITKPPTVSTTPALGEE